jgi:predicted MFS family arabinose efflux permease
MKALKQLSILAWVSWGLGTFFYMFQYILRVSPSVIGDCLIEAFCVTTVDFGQFSGSYYLGYAVMHLPLGFLLDRHPAKYILAGCFFVCGLGLVPLFWGKVWAAALIGRFLVGAGSSGAILCLFAMIKQHFPDDLFSRFLGIAVTIGVCGAIYGGYPVDRLNQAYGWTTVQAVFAIIAVVIALLILIFMPQGPDQKVQSQGKIGTFLKTLLQDHKSVFILALLGGLMVGPLEGFADVWAVPFLEKVYHLSRSESVSLPSLIFIGMALGATVLPALSSKNKGEFKAVVMSSFVMGALFVALTLRLIPTSWLMPTFLIIGFFCAYQILVIVVAVQWVPSHLTGLVSALTNMVIMAFGYVFHGAIAAAVTFAPSNPLIAGHSAQGLIQGISLIPLGMGLALAGLMGLSLWKRPPLGKKRGTPC